MNSPQRHGHSKRGNFKRHKAKKAAKLSQSDSQPLEVTIDHLGAKGDGIAKANGKSFFIPFSAPQDHLLIQPVAKRGEGFAASIKEVVQAGPDRSEAPCPVYQKCGGCSLQHLKAEFYGQWKRELVVEAFSRQGLAPLIRPLKSAPLGTRRRVSFEVIRTAGGVVLGFNTKQSHQVVAIDQCLLLLPELNQIIKPLAEILPVLTSAGDRGDVVISFIGGVMDMVFALPGTLSLQRLEGLSALAETYDIGRISWNRHKGGTPETVVHRKPVQAWFNGTPVEVPAGSFLQPSLEGETLLVEEVLHKIGDSSKIVDLFSGCGTFTFPLSKKAMVHAFEGSDVMISAMEKAAGRANIGGRIVGEVRDLERQPLAAKELNKFDAIVFDPPRAGAQDQAQMIADSKVPRVIGVSCNPNTLARDARTLVEGGYDLVTVTPVDQFPYSPHMEAVAYFEK